MGLRLSPLHPCGTLCALVSSQAYPECLKSQSSLLVPFCLFEEMTFNNSEAEVSMTTQVFSITNRISKGKSKENRHKRN